jgi:hypothetical protein
MVTEKQWHVFLGHASEDVALARAIAASLRGLGWTVFIAAEDIAAEAGSVGWSAAIDAALDRSRVLVTIASPKSGASKWVEYEWRSFHNALLSGSELGVIVPFCVGGRTRDQLERTLRYYQAVEMGGYELTPRAVVELDGLIKAHMEQRNVPRRWSIWYASVTEPNLSFLDEELSPREVDEVGVDAWWPEPLEKFMETNRERAEREGLDDLYRIQTKGQVAWKAKMIEGVRALAKVSRNADERRSLRESVHTYLAAYAVGLLQYLKGFRPLSWDPPEGDPGLSGRHIPTGGLFVGGMIALGQAKRWETIGWLSVRHDADGDYNRILLPVSAILRSSPLAPQGEVFTEQDFFRFIVPQLLDLFSQDASRSLRTILDQRPLMYLDRQHTWVVDSESYERVSPGTKDWPRIENAIISAVRGRPQQSAESAREAAFTTYTFYHELEYLSPEIARLAREALEVATRRER